MFENVSKGMIYQVNNFTMVDKKTGDERGLINIQYIIPQTNESATRLGWTTGQSYFAFTDNLWKELKGLILKNVDLKFQLVADYKDSTRYTSKLVAINDLVIKQ